MKYIMTKSAQELCDTMTKLGEGIEEPAPEFLEATAYSKHTAVVQCGHMVDEPVGEDKKLINHINWWFKPFYFKHLQVRAEDKFFDFICCFWLDSISHVSLFSRAYWKRDMTRTKRLFH